MQASIVLLSVLTTLAHANYGPQGSGCYPQGYSRGPCSPPPGPYQYQPPYQPPPQYGPPPQYAPPPPPQSPYAALPTYAKPMPYLPPNCRNCPMRPMLPPMIPTPVIEQPPPPPSAIPQGNYATRFPIPASEKVVFKERKISDTVRTPTLFEEGYQARQSMPVISPPPESPQYASIPVPAVPPTTGYSSIPPSVPADTYYRRPPPPSYQHQPYPQQQPPPYPPQQPPPYYPCAPEHRAVYPQEPPPQPPPHPAPAPAYTIRPLQPPPLNSCCARCSRPCRSAKAYAAAVRKSPNAINDTAEAFSLDNLDASDPYECTNKQLRAIFEDHAKLNMTEAKVAIQQSAEKEMDADKGIFHVLCSGTDLEYATRTATFCIGEVADGVCYAFSSKLVTH
ncbi:ground-like domain-containing protein [Ditylenchus destructor]|uniref:Ground-like domain-containing protein n=1 Tax=Ditylenchus destructor TaxID=166010 RepID=A0AAD4NBP8_9BILA|nr:ground-like domain-containing protein [Ditylenchus destructor]